MNQNHFDQLQNMCYEKAQKLILGGLSIGDIDVFELTDLLIKIEIEKLEKNYLSDQSLDFNDEIISIEHVGELETIDIGVTGDNLFYCNNILTKNSIGLPATLDLFLAIIRSEELDEMNQIMFKQLKNRYNSPDRYKRFVVGVEWDKMKLYNVEESAQCDIADSGHDDTPVFDKSTFGKRSRVEGGFGDFK